MVWSVSALCVALSDALDVRFNPISVKGELASFSRAASGHCYFTLADDRSQIKCAMFKRAASGLDFQPRAGDMVEIRGKLDIYPARGDLQIIVESMQKAGAGNLFEQFLQLKQELEAQGLFDPCRKRDIPSMPTTVGIVTSLGAAALRDVCTTLQRRAPHTSAIISPASVQGNNAPAELVAALQDLYAQPKIDVILLVRGGGAMEDLWAFNSKELALCIAQSPVPIISGVGHETDFTIADFCADLRAATPTAAAELCAPAQSALLGYLQQLRHVLQEKTQQALQQRMQNLDWLSMHLQQHTSALHPQHRRLESLAKRLKNASAHQCQQQLEKLTHHHQRMAQRLNHYQQRQQLTLQSIDKSLALMHPKHVIERGYALVQSESGGVVTSARALHAQDSVQLQFKDGHADATVNSVNLNLLDA